MSGTFFERGIVYINGKTIGKVDEALWSAHPKFKGVYTKNLFTGADCADNMNAMLVKIEPHHEIGAHVHEGKAELHEVISGGGEAVIDGRRIEYKPGVVSFIPGDTSHSVKAADAGIVLLAKFNPPLI